MNVSDTLSVDPGRTTLGDLHPELNAKILRKKGLAGMRKKRSAKNTLNFIFAINALRANGKAVAILFIRWALGAILIVSGGFILSGEINPPIAYITADVYGVLEIIAGTMLVLGLFTRLAMGIATAGFATIAVLAAIKGIFDMQSMMSCIACIIFLIFGSEKYSCDFLIRKALIIHNTRRRRKRIGNTLTYKSFHYASAQ